MVWFEFLKVFNFFLCLFLQSKFSIKEKENKNKNEIFISVRLSARQLACLPTCHVVNGNGVPLLPGLLERAHSPWFHFRCCSCCECSFQKVLFFLQILVRLPPFGSLFSSLIFFDLFSTCAAFLWSAAYSLSYRFFCYGVGYTGRYSDCAFHGWFSTSIFSKCTQQCSCFAVVLFPSFSVFLSICESRLPRN